MAFCRTMLTAEHRTQGSPVWIVLSTTLGQFFYQSIPNVIEQKEETRVTALLIFNISFTWLNLVRFQIPFVRFQLSQIQFCGRWQNAWNEWYYNSAITGQFIRRKRRWSANAETDVYYTDSQQVETWIGGNINRWKHCFTVLYCAKIIKNKDINNLGTNTLYTILFWHQLKTNTHFIGTQYRCLLTAYPSQQI